MATSALQTAGHMLRAMCARCVAEGAAYVGGALGLLRLQTYRLRLRRERDGEQDASAVVVVDDEPRGLAGRVGHVSGQPGS
jgi:hypothetical protein